MNAHRAPSPAGARQDIRRSASPSGQSPFNTPGPTHGQTSSHPASGTAAYAAQTSTAFDPNTPPYLATPPPLQYPAGADLAANSYLQAQVQAQGLSFAGNNITLQQASGGTAAPHSNNLLDPNQTAFSSFESQYFDPNDPSQSQSQHDIDVATSLYLDPAAFDNTSSGAAPGDPNSSNLYNMSNTMTQSADPSSHMLSQNAQYQPHQGSRQSLDPSSAAFPPGSNGDWSGVAFNQHRRAHSDAHSDVSSSAHPSPYLGNTEQYDGLDQPSPMLNATQDPILFNDGLGLSDFSISDPHPGQGQQHISPVPSPRLSPHLVAQHGQPPYMTGDHNQTNFPLGVQYPNVPYGVTGLPQDQMYTMGDSYSAQPGPGEYEIHDPSQQKDHFSPTPEINVVFAPPERQPSFGPKGTGTGELIPPPRRMRSTSDPPQMRVSLSREGSPSGRGRSPSSGNGTGLFPGNSLSPRPYSRTQARSVSPAGISKDSQRRASMGTAPRDPEFLQHFVKQQPSINNGTSVSFDVPVGGIASSPGSVSGDNMTNASHSQNSSASGTPNNSASKRAKHPANYQCHRCAKRFTRAYNLRSHLRTHTNEKPFVCGVCGKPFARQHDRKRHEGLHSGEKKFVCEGPLANGTSTWGCGRRFARADALGRHFKSESGRACIKPLLDEEARERELDKQSQAQQYMLNASVGAAGGVGLSSTHLLAQQQATSSAQPPAPQMAYAGSQSMPLPAALLQQYPVLANMWDTLDTGGGRGGGGGGGSNAHAGVGAYADGNGYGDDDGHSGRSSFDASSGGEMYPEDDDGEYGSGLEMDGFVDDSVLMDGSDAAIGEWVQN